MQRYAYGSYYDCNHAKYIKKNIRTQGEGWPRVTITFKRWSISRHTYWLQIQIPEIIRFEHTFRNHTMGCSLW